MAETIYEYLLKLKAEKNSAVEKVVLALAPSCTCDDTVPQRLQQAPLIQPTALYEKWIKKPDRCIGGSCSWFKCDENPTCTARGGSFIVEVQSEKASCPHDRWRLFTPKHTEQGLEPCPVCSSTKWWKTKGFKGELICAVCHPPALANHLVENVEYPR